MPLSSYQKRVMENEKLIIKNKILNQKITEMMDINIELMKKISQLTEANNNDDLILQFNQLCREIEENTIQQ